MKRNFIIIAGVMFCVFGSAYVERAIAQEQNIILTAPLMPKEKKIADAAGEDKDAKSSDSIELDAGAVPIASGMTGAEVVAILGRPNGQVKFSKKLTYFYETGEIEFVAGRVDRFKWNGKLYSPLKMPQLARERAGALSIRPNDTAARAVTAAHADAHVVKGEDSLRVSTAGTGSMSSSSGKKASTGPKSPWSRSIRNTTDKLEKISNERIELLKDTGLENLQIKNDP